MKNQMKSMILLVIAKKAVVALHLRSKSPSQLLVDAKSYEDGISKNPLTFQNPNPSMATLNGLIGNLEGTFVKASSKVNGAVAAKHVAVRALQIGLKTLAVYVESVANKNPDMAEAIAGLANMKLKAHTLANKSAFAIVQGPNSGELIMTAKGKKGNATYNFELSTDISLGANWKSVQNKTVARVVITNLTSGTRYFGRVFRTDKSGTVQLGVVKSYVVN
jgi:hypothetical protein